MAINEKPENSLESELKIAIEARSKERAHSTEHQIDDEPITEINVTPLVDVALVLVIIFMAIAPFMAEAGLQVTESKGTAQTGVQSLEGNIQIMLTADEKILLNQKEVSFTDLKSLLKEAIPKSKDRLVSVEASPANHVGQVVQILDIAKQSGAKKVALLNKQKG